MLSSDSICAFVFAVWALLLTRAWLEPTIARFALLGLATAAAALTRPGYQVLVVFALVPLVLAHPVAQPGSRPSCGVPRRRRGVARGVDREQRRFGTTTTRSHEAEARSSRSTARSRPTGSSRPRTATRRVSSPRPCVASCSPRSRTARTGSRSNGSSGTAARVSSRTSSVITDRAWGWETDYAQMREAGIEAVRAEPWRYVRGVTGTVLDELWSPLHVALPDASTPAPVCDGRARDRARARTSSFPPPSEGEQIPSARQGFFSTTPDGSITEVWTSPTEHSLVFSTPRGAAPLRASSTRRASRLERARPAVSRQRLADAPVQPLVEALPAAAPVAGRRARRVAVAAARARPARGVRSAAAALVVVSFQALAIYSIIEFAVPVAPAFVVFGAAGLLGERRRDALASSRRCRTSPHPASRARSRGRRSRPIPTLRLATLATCAGSMRSSRSSAPAPGTSARASARWTSSPSSSSRS